MSEQIAEANSDAPINVENEIGFLSCGDLLHFQRVIQQGSLLEVGRNELLDQFDSHVGVVDLKKDF